jgi:hypothetical protein
LIVLDHVAFGTSARSAATESIETLGFTPSPPSSCEWESHGERQSADAVCCVFDREYLDFITISTPEWLERLSSSSVYWRGLAPTGIVVSGAQPSTAAQHVNAKPYPIFRHLHVDPPSSISYESFPLASLGLPLGLIADSSPITLRRTSSLSHPNTALGVSAVHLRVASQPSALQALTHKPLSLPSSTTVRVGSARLHVHERPSDPYLAHVYELLPHTERPVLLAVDYAVASLEVAAMALRRRGVGFSSTSRALSVNPDQGFGAGVIFSQAGA